MSPLILAVVATAILSSLLTLVAGSLLVRRYWEREMEVRLRRLHDDIGRTVETRVRRAVAESLSESARPGDSLRESTWRAARTGSELLSDSLGNLVGKSRKWRRQAEET